MDNEKIESVLASGEFIEKDEYEDMFSSNGRSSNYFAFLQHTNDLRPGDVIYYDDPVPDSFVSGVRNQVYKLNGDSEKSDREYTVEATKEKDRSGNDVTDNEGKKLYTFCIRRKDK